MDFRTLPPLPEHEDVRLLTKGNSPVTNDETKEKVLNEKLLEMASLADSVIDSIKDDLTPSQLKYIRGQASAIREQINHREEKLSKERKLVEDFISLQSIVLSVQKKIASLQEAVWSVRKEIETEIGPLKAKTDFLMTYYQSVGKSVS